MRMMPHCWMMLPVCLFQTAFGQTKAKNPNIIFILSDDVGYGDLGCYGASLIKTPNLDRLASEGIRFTNASSPASTCTPTRYSLLTGKYAWRKNIGILPGDAPMVLKPGSLTMPELMKKCRYLTACVGKWHLGLGEKQVDFNKEIRPGLKDVGFDYSFIFPATNDRVPCVYLENDKVVGLDPGDPIQVSFRVKVGDWPTGKEHPEMLKLKYYKGHDQTIVNGISRIGYMTGGKNALWADEKMAGTITGKAVDFIKNNADTSFFLYFATHNTHEPRIPGPDFAGKSQCGVYGDFMQELDWSVGQIMKTLSNLGIEENTWIIFTSDNGPEMKEGYIDGALENLNGHRPTGDLRPGKGSLFEGGTRVPFISKWPARIKPAVSDAPFGFIDMFASFSNLLKYKTQESDSIDSRDALAVLLGNRRKTAHNEVLIQDNGKNIALRKGNWKLIPQGNTASSENYLFNLKRDIQESENLIKKNQHKKIKLETRLYEIRANSIN